MSVRDDGDAASQRSGGSGTSGNLSETSSQRSDSKFLKKRALRGQHDANEENDLLEQKRNFQEGVFACMYTLVRQSALSQLSFAVLKVVLEFLMSFIVAFNPSFEVWKIDTNNPVWQVIRWTVWRSPIMRLYGYDTYVIVMYVMAALVYVAIVGLVWLTLAMRKQEQSKGLRTAATLLHVVFDVMFVMCYVSFFDYFVFMADCDFLGSVKQHLYFKGVMCLEMPHLLHMSVALLTALLFLVVTALVVVASAELNPVSRAYLSTPASVPRLKILVAKALYIVFANCLDSNARVQCLGMLASVMLILYWNFRTMPFYRVPTNIIWTGLWGGVMSTVVVLNVTTFQKDQSTERRKQMTQIVLYSVFPAILTVMLADALYVLWVMWPARKFVALEPGVKLSTVHKFESVDDVERLARVMRKFDAEGLVDEDKAALGETIIKAGLQRFPNAPHLLILYANFVLEVRKDGPAARTQLQLAAKHTPNIIQRYQIFCTYEASKRLKGNQQECMDLQAYIEFKRNFRAVLRVHREVLVMQAELWQLCMRPSLSVAQFDRAMDALEVAVNRANQVYRRVLERYPNNGKLLRCYGKFLEDARHDHLAATKAYTEANRSGAGGALLSLDLSSGLHGADKPEFLTSMSMEDDAVVVIDAEGTIMMVSQAVQKFFGYPKVELEGANVSMLMPQPFSQRHDGYLARYVAGGEPHILDTVREVVALHKDRYVFPVALCVTRLSGVGADSIFLGVLRPLPPDVYTLRAWVAPNGAFLCSDQQFASAVGVFEGELIGHPLSALLTEPEAADLLLDRCKAAHADALAAGDITADLMLKHQYRAPVPVRVTVRLAGTDSQRILVLHCRRTDGQDGSMLAVDTHMRVKFASCEVALLLGYSMRKLASMRLDQLLPPPFNALHAKWLRDPPHAVPPSSCRSGKVVHLQAETGAQIPVRLQVDILDTTQQGVTGTAASTMYVVQVRKAAAEELFREKRLVLTADFSGRVLTVSPYDSDVFGFPSLDLLGSNLADCVDIFADWRERSGETQMQLILLALLYKEQEMPGTSWRVRVHVPDTTKDPDTALPPLPGQTRGAGGKRRASLSACLQVEMQDDGEESGEGGSDAGERSGGDASSSEPRVRITLWRRDLLTGVLELDEDLVVRRASPLTGLITGLPTTAMLRKPLSRFLNIPSVSSWDKLVAAASSQPGASGGGHHHKKSALKATPERGSISPVMAFIGPHPDTGTMRLMVQGVQTLGPGGRTKVTLTMHPDTTFTGAHANLMKVLKLDEASGRRQSGTGGCDDDGDGALSVTGTEARSRATSALPSRGARRSKSRKVVQQQLQEEEEEEEQEEAEAAAAAAAGGQGAAHATTRKADGDQANGAAETEVERRQSDEQDALVDGAAAADDDVSRRRHSRRRSRKDKADGAAASGSDDDDDDEEGPSASLHRQSSSKSEFVAQWVRTLSRRVSGAIGAAAGDSHPPGRAGSGGGGAASGLQPRGSARLDARALSRLPTITEAPVAADGEDAAATAVARVAEPPAPSSPPSMPRLGTVAKGGTLSRNLAGMPEWADVPGPRAASPQGLAGSREDADAGEAGGEKGKAEKAGSDSGDSSADGSQTAGSVISSATDNTSVTECIVDARRGRLLKALSKLLLGPALMKHIDRLRLQSYLLIFVMFLAHVISYCVITALIKTEHNYVYMVHRQAMAMDRSQLIIVRSIAGTFCERANVTDRTSICANSLNYTLGKLKTNVALMEQYHQGVYLGFDTSKVSRLDTDVYNIWTTAGLEYHVYMDTSPPQVAMAHAGAWQLGNRFIAAAREALYLLPLMADKFKLHRAYQFLKTNGLGPLFEGYASSLDLLVDAAWLSISKLKSDLLITLIVEAIVVQLCCTCYTLYLVQRTEWARLLGVLAMLGLPGPVLRQLANADTRVVDNSDDESDDDDDDSRAGDDDAKRGATGAGAAAMIADRGGGGGGAGADSDAGSGGGAAAVAVPRLADFSGAEPLPLDNKPAAGGPGARQGARAAARYAEAPAAPTSAPLKTGAGDGGGVGTVVPTTGGAVVRPSSAERVGFNLAPGAAEDDADAPRSKAGAGEGARGRGSMRVVSPSKGIRSKAGKAGTSSGRLQINGKILRPSLWNVSKFMVPFFLWNVAVILVYAVSLVKLNGMQGPLASLNMASHVTYRYTRVRAIALAFVTQDDAASRDVWRPLLINELGLFESEYDAVMYGGEPTSMAKSVFRRVVPAGTFASSSFARAFFREKGCMRYDKSTCFELDSEFYEVTHNGLDVMVRRMLTEMHLLARDEDADVAYNNSRYRFMAIVGANDLYEGLQQAAELFVDYSISRYDEVTMLHTVLLAVSVVLVLAFFLFVLWPHIRRLLRDAARLGALLSMVPPEMDVRAHVRAVLRRSAGRAAKSTAAAAAAATASVAAATRPPPPPPPP